MFYDPPTTYPETRKQIGRYFGPALDVGSTMTHKVLMFNGEYVSRGIVSRWSPEEVRNPALLQARQNFMTELEAALGPNCVPGDFDHDDVTPVHEMYADENEDGLEGTPDEELPPTPEAGDNYVGALLLLPRSGDLDMAQGKVVKRARGLDGNPMGRASDNPILDTREYVVEFVDGTEAELSANVIAQNMYAQSEPDGNCYVLFGSIVDWRRSTTALCYNAQVARKADGRTYMRRSTAGWQLCIQWKDGSTSLEKLSQIEESHSTETDECACAQGLEREPTFNW